MLAVTIATADDPCAVLTPLYANGKKRWNTQIERYVQTLTLGSTATFQFRKMCNRIASFADSRFRLTRPEKNMSSTRSRSLLALTCILAACSSSAGEIPEYQAEIIAEFDASDARQGIAVDQNYFYAVNNYAISKHNKENGEVVAAWQGTSEGDPLFHMDSLLALDGQLFASHSNYPSSPMTSSVEVWNADDMKHVASHSFGIHVGSMTWLDQYNGEWWGAFANYDKIQKGQSDSYGTTNRTQIVRFSNEFLVLEAWTLPLEVLDRMRPMSNSGGSWGPDGYLYLTGHDHGELYVMEIPEFG